MTRRNGDRVEEHSLWKSMAHKICIKSFWFFAGLHPTPPPSSSFILNPISTQTSNGSPKSQQSGMCCKFECNMPTSLTLSKRMKMHSEKIAHKLVIFTSKKTCLRCKIWFESVDPPETPYSQISKVSLRGLCRHTYKTH